MSSPNASKVIIDFCLENFREAPVHQRISLCRALATFCGDEKESAEFLQIADALASAEVASQKLQLKLKLG